MSKCLDCRSSGSCEDWCGTDPSELYEDLGISKEIINQIEEYCKPHKEFMWAAIILGMIQGCDFKDVK